MPIKYGNSNAGLIYNGRFNKDNSGFTTATFRAGDSFSGTGGSLEVTGNGTLLGDDYIPVDTSMYSYMSVSAKTIARSGAGNLGSGHLGFVCYDKNKLDCELRTQGGVGDTTFSRPVSVGDSYVYIASNAGWQASNSTYYFRVIVPFPATHPDYSVPYKYSRIGYEYGIHYNEMVQMPELDWRLKLCNASDVAITWPNIGYAIPAGTPVSNGVAGGTYNYALGAPNYPETWTRYETPMFVGESRNSAYPFRYGTKYIRFMNLKNYNFAGAPYATYLLDDIIFVQTKNPNINLVTSKPW